MAQRLQPSGTEDKGSQSQSTGATASDSMAANVIAEFDSLESQAMNFRARWQDCANYIDQRKGNILTFLAPGSPQTILIWDTTADDANTIFAAGLVSFLTPTSEQWAALRPKDPDASQDWKDWLDDSSKRMMQEMAGSNFYEVWHEDCLDNGQFGNSLMRTDLDDTGEDSILNYSNIPVGTFYWSEDNRGRVGRICRKWKWTARQAAEEFGADNLPQILKKAYEGRSPAEQAQEFTFIERVSRRPKDRVRQGATVPQHRTWECVYVCRESQSVLREEGFYENPYAACRLMRSNNEVYGRGPGTQAMPDIKMVNRMEEDILTVIERMARPGWIMPDDSAYEPDNRPDGITYWDATDERNKPEQLELKNRVDLGEEKTDKKREVIRRYFYNDMFKLLTREDVMEKEKTAYEVSQMVAERLILFSPIFGRITKEKLTPLLYRTFAIMLRKGKFRPLPMGLDPKEVEFEITYTSKIALAIKALENQSLATALQLIQAAMSVDPTVKYLLNTPKAVREVMANAGVKQSWMRSDAEVAALAQRDQDEMAQLQAAQAAQAGSQVVKNLGPQAQSQAAKGVAAAAPQAKKMAQPRAA